MMVFGLRALHPPHPLRLQQQQQLHRLPASWHRLPASWHLPRPCAHHCLSCRPWRCRSLVRLLADIPRQAGLPAQSDRAYASSSSCDGKRACACAPKASAADARVQKIMPNAASASHSGCRAARGCCQRTCGQHQSAEHVGRRRRRHCRCSRPVPPNASLRLAAPTERLPGGRQCHRTTSLRGPRPSTDASAAPLPATSPASPRPAAPSPSAATATPGRVGRATRACGCSCASSSAAIRPGSSVGGCALRAPCARPNRRRCPGCCPGVGDRRERVVFVEGGRLERWKNHEGGRLESSCRSYDLRSPPVACAAVQAPRNGASAFCSGKRVMSPHAMVQDEAKM